MSSEKLYSPLKVGAITAANRIFMAPLTRLRSIEPGDIPTPLMAEYYRQRASAGLIISEATQQALLGDDFSVTGASLTIITLITIDIVLGKLKARFPLFEQMAEGGPLILVEHGRILTQRLKMSGISREDILEAARSGQGLERIDQIKYAVLEVSGHISIIPENSDKTEK